jgi:hypothetical protein
MHQIIVAVGAHIGAVESDVCCASARDRIISMGIAMSTVTGATVGVLVGATDVSVATGTAVGTHIGAAVGTEIGSYVSLTIDCDWSII